MEIAGKRLWTVTGAWTIKDAKGKTYNLNPWKTKKSPPKKNQKSKPS